MELSYDKAIAAAHEAAHAEPDKLDKALAKLQQELRAVDEPRSRPMSEILVLAIKEELRCLAILRDTKGADERAEAMRDEFAWIQSCEPQTIEQARERSQTLRAMQPTIRELEAAARAHVLAQTHLNGVRAVFSRLLKQTPRNHRHDPLWMLGPELHNAIAVVVNESPGWVWRHFDGWVWSTHPEPPRKRTTLQTVHPPRKVSRS